jgi:anti-anti-sigma factor
MVRHAPFEFQATMQDATARIAVAGELDIATVSALEGEARTMLARGARELIIDLRRLTFIDSSGLRLLISLNNDAARGDWSLVLIRPRGVVLAVLRISGAAENLPFRDDPDSL